MYSTRDIILPVKNWNIRFSNNNNIAQETPTSYDAVNGIIITRQLKWYSRTWCEPDGLQFMKIRGLTLK